MSKYVTEKGGTRMDLPKCQTKLVIKKMKKKLVIGQQPQLGGIVSAYNSAAPSSNPKHNV